MARLDEDLHAVRATAEAAEALGLTDVFELLEVLETAERIDEARRGEPGFEFFGSRP